MDSLLTLGEPAGIGPDAVLLAYQANASLFDSVVICAPAIWLHDRALLLGLDLAIVETLDWDAVKQLPKHALRCWNPLGAAQRQMLAQTPVQVGVPIATTAQAVIDCIEYAARKCLQGEAHALVTAPIEKAILKSSGFEFPGHTEFLAAICACHSEVMMLASNQLRVALLTTHIALRDVPASLSKARTTEVIQIVAEDMKRRFGLKKPRIALCALNPHAGEQGHFGDEEMTLLQPVVAELQQQGIDLQGPISADTLFAQSMRQHFDVIVCCYHDQALIPIKTLSFGEAVNVTLGLPIIRTSVDHGTALTRAGTGEISYSSLVAAIEMAQRMDSDG